jgi:hypothetical protein
VDLLDLCGKWGRNAVLYRLNLARRSNKMSEYYDFEVVKDDEVVSTKRGVRLWGLRAAWPIILELAALHMKGRLIRVRNARGEIEILIGVATAKRYLAAKTYALIAALVAFGDPLDLFPV